MKSFIDSTFRSTTLAGVLLVMVGIAVGVGVLAGCENPVPTREQYKVLKVFFDGVPDPDHPRKVAHSVRTGPAEGEGVVVTTSIVSRHKPFVDNKCASCHHSATGTVMEFDEAYKLCVKCHEKVPTSKPRMHGPVAVPGGEGCRWCHAPHESSEPHLLKGPPIEVCTQCHDQQLLSAKPMEHTDGKTSCLSCHFGHGGEGRYFLTPKAAERAAAGVPLWGATTAPATAPAEVRPLPDASPFTLPAATAPEEGRGP